MIWRVVLVVVYLSALVYLDDVYTSPEPPAYTFYHR